MMMSWLLCGVSMLGMAARPVSVEAEENHWEIGEPIVTYWGGPGCHGHPEKLTERVARQLSECGFNVAWATTIEELDVAAKYGLRVVYDFQIPLDDLKARTILKPLIDGVKNHPALFLYHDRDEPSARRFQGLADSRDWFAKQDPRHALWLNLFPLYASNEQLGTEGEHFHAYWDHVRRCAEIYRPEIISYDHYQFRMVGDTAFYFLNLAVIRQSAAALDIPFLNGVQASSWIPGSAVSPSSPRIPGVDEMRYLVYTTLAYGAQGIYYYVYSYPKHSGSIVDMDGKPGSKYHALKALNRAFVSIAKELRSFRFVGAYFNGCQAPGTTPYGPGAVLRLSPDVPAVSLPRDQWMKNSTLVTRFSKSGRGDRFMVVNLDYRQIRRISISGPMPLLRFDVMTGTWSSIGEDAVSVELKGGEGILLSLVNFENATR